MNKERLLKTLRNSVRLIEEMATEFSMENDEFTQGELKAYRDIIEGIEDMEETE